MVENWMQLYLPDIVLGNHPQASHLFAPGHSVPKKRKEQEGERRVQSLRVWLMDGSSSAFLLPLPMFSAFLIPLYPASEKVSYLSGMSNYIREFTLCQMELKFSRVIWGIKGWKYYPFIFQNIGGESSSAVNNVLAYSVTRLLL